MHIRSICSTIRVYYVPIYIKEHNWIGNLRFCINHFLLYQHQGLRKLNTIETFCIIKINLKNCLMLWIFLYLRVTENIH